MAPVGMELGRAGLQCLKGIGDDGEWFKLDLDEVAGPLGPPCRLCNYHSNLIPDEADHVRAGSIRSRPAEDGLIGSLKPVFVDRNVLGCEDRYGLGKLLRPRRVDAQHARMRPAREEYPGVEHSIHHEVARVLSLSGDFCAGINTGGGFTNMSAHRLSSRLEWVGINQRLRGTGPAGRSIPASQGSYLRSRRWFVSSSRIRFRIAVVAA